MLGQLNFIEKSTWADIAYTVHQCTKFSENLDPQMNMQCKDWKVPDEDKGEGQHITTY